MSATSSRQPIKPSFAVGVVLLLWIAYTTLQTLFVVGLAGVQGWESAPEKRAAEFVLEVCTSGGDRGMARERKPQ